MKLGDKLRSLRAVEGSASVAWGRSMTQQELARRDEEAKSGRGLSQAYLSQIENGARPHLTHTTRELLARFFRVYPGFLVDDPEGYTPGLQSELRAIDAKIDLLAFCRRRTVSQADPTLQRALLVVAEHEDLPPGDSASGGNPPDAGISRAPRGSLAPTQSFQWWTTGQRPSAAVCFSFATERSRSERDRGSTVQGPASRIPARAPQRKLRWSPQR